MTPLDVLMEWATSLGWQIVEEGYVYRLQKEDSTGTDLPIGTLQTQAGRYPVRLVFDAFEVPDVVAQNEEDLRKRFTELENLNVFKLQRR